MLFTWRVNYLEAARFQYDTILLQQFRVCFHRGGFWSPEAPKEETVSGMLPTPSQLQSCPHESCNLNMYLRIRGGHPDWEFLLVQLQVTDFCSLGRLLATRRLRKSFVGHQHIDCSVLLRGHPFLEAGWTLYFGYTGIRGDYALTFLLQPFRATFRWPPQ